ncbi:hypothetical protein [Heliorestis convoluta]|uniref:Uncharacterized protein n=1 Tax=Heliorestis convoluta TaxID=356322 RepID=A0A5Q2N523_9FIRM|nr:hypothetical protein [Heliorestis convoluta]QGG47685.1 hypothetical protein FTV88_1585 [Heliorestis convoluta]
MYEDKFYPDGEYKQEFEEEVDVLIKKEQPLPWRIEAVKILTDIYVQRIGEMPESKQLERLANYILSDELKDRHPDKVANTEYPIFSDVQLKVRQRREVAFEKLEQMATNARDRKPKKQKKSYKHLSQTA